MSGENTVSSLAGYYKKVYGDRLNELVPASSVIYDLVEFSESKRVGDSYNEPCLLTLENGFTVNGVGGTVVTLNAASNAVSKEASIQAVELVGRAQMAYTAASRAAAEGQAAFGKAWGQVLKNLRVSHMKRLELMLTHGQLGLGTVESVSAPSLVITEATWSPALWCGLEGALFEFWTGTSASETKHGLTAGCPLVSVANSTRTLTFPATTIDQNTSAAAGDVIMFYGARTTTTFAEPVGLLKIAANTGILFGISGVTYNMFAANPVASFGAMSMGKLLDAVSQAVDRGLDEKVICGVCPRSYEVLNADLAADRHFDGSYSKSKLENGTQSIDYYGQAGQVQIVVMPFLQRSQAVVFPPSALKLVGSADAGMGVPGTDGRDVFFHLQDKNAIEARSFSDLSLLCTSPAKLVSISGITY